MGSAGAANLLAKLLAVARARFGRAGFAGVSAEDLVREAGLTRGALYHQFGGKDGLFLAVYEDLQREIAARIEAAAAAAPDAWAALRLGSRAFLAACVDPEVQRIVLLDAPAVRGWERWREGDNAEGLRCLPTAPARRWRPALWSPNRSRPRLTFSPGR